MIRTIITAITGFIEARTGGPKVWKVVKNNHGAVCLVTRYKFRGETVIRERLTHEQALRLARRLRQQAEDRPEAVL